MKNLNLLFVLALLAWTFIGGVRADEPVKTADEPGITIPDIFDNDENFGPFQSVSKESMGEWLFVDRFVESADPKGYRRYMAVGLRLREGEWSGSIFVRVLENGVVSHEYGSALSTVEARRFIAMIDASDVFNLTGFNRNRIGKDDGNTLMGEEITSRGNRSFIRGTELSTPARQVSIYFDTFLKFTTRPSEADTPSGERRSEGVED